jgi:hypothetical protein
MIDFKPSVVFNRFLRRSKMFNFVATVAIDGI